MRPDPDLLQRWVIADGVPPTAVGALLGLSRAAGYNWLNRYGIIPSGPSPSQESLVARWRAGASAAQLAAEVGLLPDAVRERLVTASVLRPNRSYFKVGSPDDPLPEHLLRDWYVRESFTVAQIAELTATTARQVRYRLARYRLSSGRPGPAPRVKRTSQGLRPTAPKIDASTGEACSSASGSGRHSLTATTPGSISSSPAKNSSNWARVRG